MDNHLKLTDIEFEQQFADCVIDYLTDIFTSAEAKAKFLEPELLEFDC